MLSEEGRADRLGSELACPPCARAELPSGLSVRRHLGPFDETDLPSGLQKAHRVPAGQWGLLRILSGSVNFWMESEPPVERHLSAGVEQPIPPEVRHELRLTGPVSLTIELLSA